MAVLFGSWLCAIPFAGLSQEPPASLSELDWIVGNWVFQEGDFRSEHLWIEQEGQVILGIQRDTRAEETQHVEFIELREGPDGIVFHVYPIGQEPTDFWLVSSEPRRAVFENLEHDYPQRITYWAEGDATLVARIEGDLDGTLRRSEWRWQKEP